MRRVRHAGGAVTAMLEVRNVCKSYRGRQVLAPVSFTLEAGECLGLAGTNGSGKSTLLRLMAQVQPPDSGQILFQGRDTAGDKGFLRRRLGCVPQEDALAEELTVRQQLRLWQAACGLSGPLPKEILRLCGLEDLLKSPVAGLSGGTRRRVSVAMALLPRPDILLMDEATVGLDEGYRQSLLEWMAAFLRNGGRAVWCTHRPEELERLCTRCMRLEDGKARWGL